MSNQPTHRAVEVERTPDSVFVGNLSYFCTHNQLRDLLSPFGSIRTIKVCKTKQKEPLHYGFGRYFSVEAAQTAIKELDGKPFMGRKLRLRSGEAPSTALPSALEEGVQVLVSFVSYQMHTNITEEILSRAFSSYGNVLDCVVKSYVSHRVGASQKQGGYGFVAFSTRQEVETVLAQGSIKFYYGNIEINCDCKLSKATATRLGIEMPVCKLETSKMVSTQPRSPFDDTCVSENADTDDHVSVLTMSSVVEESGDGKSPSTTSLETAVKEHTQSRPASFSSACTSKASSTTAQNTHVVEQPQHCAVQPPPKQYLPGIHHPQQQQIPYHTSQQAQPMQRPISSQWTYSPPTAPAATAQMVPHPTTAFMTSFQASPNMVPFHSNVSQVSHQHQSFPQPYHPQQLPQQLHYYAVPTHHAPTTMPVSAQQVFPGQQMSGRMPMVAQQMLPMSYPHSNPLPYSSPQSVPYVSHVNTNAPNTSHIMMTGPPQTQQPLYHHFQYTPAMQVQYIR